MFTNLYTQAFEQRQAEGGDNEAAAAVGVAGNAEPLPALVAALAVPAQAEPRTNASMGAPAGLANQPNFQRGVTDEKVQAWLRHASITRMGRKLLGLRDEHHSAGLNLERYGLNHVHKLGTAQRMFDPSGETRVYCKDIHNDRGCKLCTTCHWCRQKTTSIKTRCTKCHGNKRNTYGGQFAGVICGSCLWSRFGENINEVLENPTWKCPACRGICNCSGSNCIRAEKGWLPTAELVSEARGLGYESVAHYLVLSQLDESLIVQITDNAQNLHVVLERENRQLMQAAKQRKKEKDSTFRLLARADTIAQRELAEVQAASALSEQLAREVESDNHNLLDQLGFGHALLDDLDDGVDDDEYDDALGAAPGGAAVAAQSAAARTAAEQPRPLFERGPSPALAGLEASAGATAGERPWGNVSLTPSAPLLSAHSGGAGSVAAAASVHRTSRLTLRVPGQLPPQPMSAPVRGVLAEARARPPGNGQRPGAVAGNAAPGLPGASGSAAVALRLARSGPLAGSVGGAAAAPARVAGVLDAADMSARASVGAAVSSREAEERQQQLEGLLHKDHGAAFPMDIDAPNGEGLAPGLAAGHRPTSRAAAGLGQAPLPQQPLRHVQQHQSRLTPLAVQGSRQQQAAAAGALPASRHAHKVQQPQQHERSASVEPAAASAAGGDLASDAQQELLEGGLSPGGADAAEPSQQLGLSPGGSAGGADVLPGAAAPALAGPQAESPVAPAAGGVPAMAAAVAGAGQGAQDPRPYFSGWAEEWGELYRSAKRLVFEIQQDDPLSASYRPDPAVTTREEKEARYRETYEHNVAELQDVLAVANKCLTTPMVVRRQGVTAGLDNVLPTDALKPLLGLYNLLAAVLPSEVVQWQVVPRMLGQECFVEFKQSEPAPRLMLVEGWISLLDTLHFRQLPIKDTCMVVADAVATLAEEVHDMSQLLSALMPGSAVQMLPEEDRQIGTHCYDAEERRRPRDIVFTRADAYYKVLVEVLKRCLSQHCARVARVLQHDASLLMTRRLASALLGRDSCLPVDLRIHGLGLLFQVVCFSSVMGQEGNLHLSVEESNRRRDQRLGLCEVVKDLLPLLEGLVARAACGLGTVDEPSTRQLDNRDRLDKCGVSTLARVYGFLLECQQLNWQHLEAKALQPSKSALLFWRHANRKLRCYGMALITDALKHAPSLSVPDNPRFSSAVIKHWFLCLLERGRRFTAGERLTKVLCQQQQTSLLFANLGLREGELESDRSGIATAKLLWEVVRRMSSNPAWRTHLAEMLEGVDEVVMRRESEMSGDGDGTGVRDRLRYGARLYRLLSAVLLAAAPAVAQPMQPAARQLVQRLALLAAGSCLGVHSEYRELERRRPAVQSANVPAAPEEKGHVRKRLAGLPFGELERLWSVLLAFGAPAAFSDPALVKAAWTVVGGTLELCWAREEPTAFDEVVLEALADSLVKPREQPHAAAAYPLMLSAHGLHDLRGFVLEVFVRRLLERADQHITRSERMAVNAVRLLEKLLSALGSPEAAQTALLPLLRALLGVMGPGNEGARSQATRQAVHRLLARLLQGELVQPVTHALLPPYSLPAVPAPAQRTLHTFWEAVAADALLCFQDAAVQCLTPGDPRAEQLKQAVAGVETLKKLRDLPRLIPLNPRSAAAASNTLRAQLRWSSEAADRLLPRQLWEEVGPPVSSLLRLELEGRDSLLASGRTTFRPGDFYITVAKTAMALVAAFLTSGSEAGQVLLGEAGSPQQQLAAAAGVGAATEWRAQPAGFQWALACHPVLFKLVLTAGSATALPSMDFLEFHNKAVEKLGQLVCLRFQPPRQVQAAAAPAGPASAAAVAMPAASFCRQPSNLQQQQQQQALQVQVGEAVPAASSAHPAPRQQQQQQQQIKQEPLSQAAAPVARALPQPSSPAAMLPRRQQQQASQGGQLKGDVSFAVLPSLPEHEHVSVVGRLKHKPQLKEQGQAGAQVLKMDLRDHRHTKLVLFVNSKQHGLLVQRLLDEAEQRFSSSSSQPHILRATGMRVLKAQATTASSAVSSGSGSSNAVLSCLLLRHGSIEWDPTGAHAEKIRRAAAAEQQRPGQVLASQATVMATQLAAVAHRPTDAAATPAIHWSQQQQQHKRQRLMGHTQQTPAQQPAAGCPAGTQVQEAGALAASQAPVGASAGTGMLERWGRAERPPGPQVQHSQAAPVMTAQQKQQQQQPQQQHQQPQQHHQQPQQHHQQPQALVEQARKVMREALKLLMDRGLSQDDAKQALRAALSQDKAAQVSKAAQCVSLGAAGLANAAMQAR